MQVNLRQKLFYIVKYIGWIYNLYFYLGTACIKILKLFVNPDPKLILFSSFGGKKYDDSPKSVYEAMIKDKRFDDFRIVWAFNHPEEFEIARGSKVKCDTLQYFVTALKASVWVTNSTIERGLSFKGKRTFYFNTWHGTPIKKMGLDIDAGNKSFKGKGKWEVDIMAAQSAYDVDIYSKAFQDISREKFRIIGLPRNDVYAEIRLSYVDELKRKLNIPLNKSVILYAPTFREYSRDSDMQCKLVIPMTLDKWKSILGEKYVLLFRAHYEVAKHMDIKDDDFIRDVSAYPSLEDLMIASDVLVSDYSSIFFDYSIMHKPMLCFAYDYEEYAQKRGMYFDIREYLPTANNEESLLEMLVTDLSKHVAKIKAFQDHFVTEFGSASRKSLDLIYEQVTESNEKFKEVAI